VRLQDPLERQLLFSGYKNFTMRKFRSVSCGQCGAGASFKKIRDLKLRVATASKKGDELRWQLSAHEKGVTDSVTSLYSMLTEMLIRFRLSCLKA
jgi:hypothetical protein